MERNIPSDYLIGKTEREKAAVKRLWKADAPILDEIRTIVRRKSEELERTSPTDYNINNWPYYRADRDGYRRALEDVLQLLP